MKNKFIKKHCFVLPMFLGLISCGKSKGESKEEIAKKAKKEERERLKALFDKDVFENGIGVQGKKVLIKNGTVFLVKKSESEEEEDAIESIKKEAEKEGDENVKNGKLKAVSFLESLVKLKEELSK